MDLSIDEQCLIAEFRKLPPSGREELLAYAATLARRNGAADPHETGPASDQCRVKVAEPRPETEKGPIFTE